MNLALAFWCASFAVFEACRFTATDRGAYIMAGAYCAMTVSGGLAWACFMGWL
jgi:hypothetical protein